SHGVFSLATASGELEGGVKELACSGGDTEGLQYAQDGIERNWRRGRDSNPRSGFTPDNCLAGSPVRPLQHLSAGTDRTAHSRGAHRESQKTARGSRPRSSNPAAPPPRDRLTPAAGAIAWEG